MPKEQHSYTGPLRVQYEYDPDCWCHGTGRHDDDTTCGGWVIDSAVPTVDQLADMLRAQAVGDTSRQAAVELLVGHGHWLRVAQFRRIVDCFLGFGSAASNAPDTPMALIDWRAVREALDAQSFPASGSELALLRIAASLASNDVTVNLYSALAGLDRTNSRLVADAVACAAQLGQG